MRDREKLQLAPEKDAQVRATRARPDLAAQGGPNARQNIPPGLSSLLASGLIQAKLRVSQPLDPDEQQADAIADRIVVEGDHPEIHRKCECNGASTFPKCGQEQIAGYEGIRQNASSASPLEQSVPESFIDSIGHGEPMDPKLRKAMESRFGQDFGGVRIHTGDDAAQSANSIQARAFTAGNRIVFGSGEYAPHSSAGRRLLAHELVHVAQNKSAQSGSRQSNAPKSIQRESLVGKASEWYSEKTAQAGKWVDEKKWEIYRGMIAALKKSKNMQVSFLRSLVPKLPASVQSAASGIIDVVDFVIDLEIALMLAIIGLAVGFVEGLVGLISGLLKLAIGLLKMTVDWLVSLLGRPDEYRKDWDDLLAAVKAIPPGLTQIKDQWLERYRHATLEEQVLMGGELVGQIEAFIAAFAFAGTKAGQATTLTLRTGQVGLRVGGRATAVAALERAPAVVVTIPAVVPKTAAEAAVVSSQMMMSSSGGGPGPLPAATGGSSGGGKGPLHGASDEELDKAVEGMKPAGDPVKLTPHGAATENRKALGLSGKDVQSAHGSPQAVMKPVPGYNPNHALTTLMERGAHSAMDKFWKETFQAMRRAGRTQASAQEIHDIVAESIRRAPDLSVGEKSSLIARLSDEMFVEFGLKPGDLLDLPYPNIGP